MVDWPDNFPSTTMDGFSVRPEDNTMRTRMDSGLTRMRQRFTTTPTIVKLRWIMKEEVFAMFEAWYKYKAKFGAEWVSMEIPTGRGMEEANIRFTRSYSSKQLSDEYWEVVADVEVRELPTYTEAELDALLARDFDDDALIVQLSNRLHTLIHTTIPTTSRWS